VAGVPGLRCGLPRNGSDKIQGYRFTASTVVSSRLQAGAKLANTRSRSIAFGGMERPFRRGSGTVHAVRSNYPITFVLHNNENFA